MIIPAVPKPTTYWYRQDPALLGLWLGDSGLLNQVPQTPLQTYAIGDFTVAVNGSAPSAVSGVNGNAAINFQTTRGQLQSSDAAQGFAPYHLFIVGQAVTTTAEECWLCSTNFGGLVFDVEDSGHFGLRCGSLVTIPATVTNLNVIEIYVGNSQTHWALNFGAYTAVNSGGQTVYGGGLTLGSNAGGTLPSNFKLYGLYMLQGQASDQFRQGLLTDLKAQFPSLGLPSTIQPAFSVAAPNNSALFGQSTPPRIILVTGQSQFTCQYLAAGGATPNSNTWILGKDLTYKALPVLWSDPTNQVDRVYATPLPSGATGGPLVAVANAYQNLIGGSPPILILQSALGGSNVYTSPPNTPPTSWIPNFPNGLELRSSLIGAACYQYEDAKAKGAIDGFWLHGQGETEGSGIAPFDPSYWQTNTAALQAALFARLGPIAHKMVFYSVPATVPSGFLASTWAQEIVAQNTFDDGVTRLCVPSQNGPFTTSVNLHWEWPCGDANGQAFAQKAVTAGWF